MERAVDCIKSCVAAGIHGHLARLLILLRLGWWRLPWLFCGLQAIFTKMGWVRRSCRRKCSKRWISVWLSLCRGFAGMYRGRRDLHAGTVDRPIDGK